MENKIVVDDFRTVKKVTLPDSKVTVELYSSVLVKDVADLGVSKKEEVDVKTSIQYLIKLIKSWNMYDSQEAEKPSEINEVNIGKLSINDLTCLSKESGEFIEEIKKD